MRVSILILIFAGLSTAGCEKAVERYVASVAPTNNAPAIDPNIYAPGQTAVKVSPGSASLTSSNAAASVTVTTTRKVLTASDMSAQVGLSRTRSQ